MTSKFLLAWGRMELHVLRWGQRSANIACDTLEKLIEGGEGVALESATAFTRGDAALFCRMAYRLFTDARIDFWETKPTPRMRCRMRYWQLTSI